VPTLGELEWANLIRISAVGVLILENYAHVNAAELLYVADSTTMLLQSAEGCVGMSPGQV